jgi:hypothetical protein
LKVWKPKSGSKFQGSEESGNVGRLIENYKRIGSIMRSGQGKGKQVSFLVLENDSTGERRLLPDMMIIRVRVGSLVMKSRRYSGGVS